jgi:hypothetical protein
MPYVEVSDLCEKENMMFAESRKKIAFNDIYSELRDKPSKLVKRKRSRTNYFI